MRIYSTRHGETDYNSRDIILGTTDLPLNRTGMNQAAALAEEIARIGGIDLIISSPMQRAMMTSTLISVRCNLQIITDERLREWDYGSYEGKTRYAEGFAEGKTEFGVKMGGSGESLLALAHRVYSALDDIIRKYGDRTVLIVSHGGVCRVIETYFNDMTTESFSNWFMGNCQLIAYDITGGNYENRS
ncbi:MAG: histidine phosphatase family protein [Ruminococcus sp.]|nr:histidine phosphatase family protein [Ruminococcus sp.]